MNRHKKDSPVPIDFHKVKMSSSA